MMLAQLKKIRRAAEKGAGAGHDAIAQLRDLRLRLLDQRDDVERRPLPLEAVQEAAAAAVAREAERIVGDLNLAALLRPADGRSPRLELTAEQRAGLAFAGAADTVADLIKARLAAKYETFPEPIEPYDKESELARIDREIQAAEFAEEAAIRALERVGAAPLRRADAAPEALLAADVELS
ncbi:MAG: hypothetical protein ACU0AX_02605 [Roseovarius sp.]|uniref:hypothetical protein n=1 Tax=Roseovarius sp. TaxID=1486281 RepID=UPI00405A4A2B